MLRARHRYPDLPPELLERALDLLAQNTRESRLAAAQLLAHGYDLDEQRRQAAIPLEDQPEPAGDDADEE